MDISSINSYNTSINQANMAKTEQAKTESFQSELEKAVENKDDKKLKEACKEFETYFINYIFKQMQSSVYAINKDKGLIKRSQGEEMFSEMLIEEYSKTATENGGIGLANMMYKQMSEDLKEDTETQKDVDK